MWNIEANLTLGTKNKLKLCISFDYMQNMQVRQQQTPQHLKVSSVSKIQLGKNLDRSLF